LWAGLGGMGAALPAVMERRRLNDFCIPVAFTLGAMVVSNLFIHPWLAETLVIPGAELMGATWHRHHNPLYWFDADWFSAVTALAAVCVYDLWDRRFARWRMLLLLCVAGAAAGAGVYYCFDIIGLNDALAGALVIPLGDAHAVNPGTGEPFGDVTFLSNWPNFVHYYPRHLGWMLGLVIGAGVYFVRYGEWRHDSKLILYLSCGWLLGFLLMPTLGSIPLQSIGGFRLTPPRSDDWAGITGVFVAGGLYCLRHKLGGVAFAGSVTGLIGGFFFIFAPFLRALLRMPGHPLRSQGASEAWTHYQSANWHSIMEQMHGFGHGVGLAVALGLLAGMIHPHDDSGKRRRGVEIAAIAFVLFFVTLMNVFKNVRVWTETTVPETMKAPLFGCIEWSAGAWFLVTWGVLSGCIIALMIIHLRHPLPIVPASWRVRGQILYLAFLWIMVIANFERALVGFHENRLVTEWVIIINAALATFLIVSMPRPAAPVQAVAPASYAALLLHVWCCWLPAIAGAIIVMAVVARLLYGAVPLEGPGLNHKRWGDEAQWRIKPILKQGKHL